ncbi:MAG: hypothetical protein KKH68_06340 [Proteobacteria bacterium]|nr:hypothetical protein [Pseudomonadota bacterium]
MVRALRKVIELAQPGSEYYDNAQNLIGVMEQSMRENDGAGLEAFINGQDEFDPKYEPAIIDKKRNLLDVIVQEDDPNLLKTFSRDELIEMLSMPGSG